MPPAYDTPLGWAVLVVAGFVASSVNAFAGGGTLVSFPALIGLGVAEQAANATNSMALWPGSLSSAVGFKDKFAATKHHYPVLVPATVIGATAGAWLMIVTPSSTFRVLIPVLILLATLILAFQPKVKAWLTGPHGRTSRWTGAVLQFLISVYGGYFGAGMGIMMLAAMALFVEGDIHDLNALKNTLAVVINVVAMGWFLAKGLVLLGPCLALMAGAVAGGYVAARVSQKVASDKLRTVVVVYGLAMSAYFFYRLVGAR
ncbi:MAG: sulfite exporter TauE/SafE family protein [Armatimonadetes bacterium]|nr:sulfite exporter TauE/SafE family protein [Armatimonadota bacterium]